MSNLRLDVFNEFQKSIGDLTRFGQEMETLDARFGRLNQRVSVMKSSMNAWDQQVAQVSGGILRKQREQEMNNLMQAGFEQKMSKDVKEKITGVIKEINDAEISPLPKLKLHLINQINRINNQLIKKIKEQTEAQVNSILQEISLAQSSKSINTKLQNATIANGGSSTSNAAAGSQAAAASSAPSAGKAEKSNPIALEKAIVNVVRNAVKGSIGVDPMNMLDQAFKTFKDTQTEMFKMTQSLMTKKEYMQKNPDGSTSPDRMKIDTATSDLRSFIRQQSVQYGTGYNELFQVGNIGTGEFNDQVETKKLVQMVAHLKALEPGSNGNDIANKLIAVKTQFGLEMADMQKQIVEPMAAVKSVTNVPITKLIEDLGKNGQTFKGAGISPEMALVLTGTSVKSSALAGSNPVDFYNNVLNKLQSVEGLQKLKEMGGNPYNINPRTGDKTVKPEAELVREFTKVLESKDEKTKNDFFDGIFGSDLSPKDPAAMQELMNNFVTMNEAVQAFTSDDKSTKYKEMLQRSVDNPVVNLNRANEGVTVILDTIVQDLGPIINKVSSALINMAKFVERNAEIFAQLGKVLSNVLIGSLMIKGIKWGAGKVSANVNSNADIYRRRTGFLEGVGHLAGTGLIDDKIKGMTDKEVGKLQKVPQLDNYVREMHGMTQQQREHFKNFLTTKSIKVSDLPTLFTAMDEAKSWSPAKELSYDDKFDRQKQYNNRLAKTDMADSFNPHFRRSMLKSTANQVEYEDQRHNLKYAAVSDKMTSMSPKQFRGFEKFVSANYGNGLPQINSYNKLSEALEKYETKQKQVAAEALRSSPAFGTLSEAVEKMNQSVSRTERLRKGFTAFLKDIPNLGRGAAKSLGNLAGGIGNLALQIISAVGVAQAIGGLTEAYTSTSDERVLKKAEDRENDLKGMSNTVGAVAEGGWPMMRNLLTGIWNDGMNTVTEFFGGTPTEFGASEFIGGYYKNIWKIMNGEEVTQDDLGLYGEMMKYYNFSGSAKQFSEWLKKREDDGIATVEQSIAEFDRGSGRYKETQKLREEAAIKQYEETQLKQEEEEKLNKIAADKYKDKLVEGKVKYSTNDTASAIKRVQEKTTDIKNENMVETLRGLMGGMRTDSDAYFEMRKKQVKRMREVLNEELALIDKHIAGAKAIMEKADPTSAEYKDAADSIEKAMESKKKIINASEAEILQEEYNIPQEQFQARLSKVSRSLQKIDLLAQAKELAAAYNMDTQSKEYIDAMKKIALNKIKSMTSELTNLKAVQAMGDQTEEKAMQILQLENSISSERSKLKEYSLASIGIRTQKLGEHNSERENELLRLKLTSGNPDDSSPILRNKRIANAKAEVSEINSIIQDLKSKLKGAGAEETREIQTEIRDLQKQSLQAQLGILDEMKSTAGTFNLPKGITAMTRYEYLTRQNTHKTTTVGMGDVTVNITLPNVTNTTNPQQLREIGQGIGQGFSQGRIGGVRAQLGGNPTTNYRSRY